MDLLDIVTALFSQYGLVGGLGGSLAGLNVYFVRRVIRQADRQQKQIDDLNKEMRESVTPLVVRCTDALLQCKDVITHNSQVFLRLINDRVE